MLLANDTKRIAANHLWRRADNARRLYHALRKQGKRTAARRCADIKLQALRRAFELMEGEITIVIADDQPGLLSIRWQGHGRMHLPCDADI